MPDKLTQQQEKLSKIHKRRKLSFIQFDSNDEGDSCCMEYDESDGSHSGWFPTLEKLIDHEFEALPLTMEDIQARVAQVQRLGLGTDDQRRDPEGAAGEERQLWLETLQAISTGTIDPKEAASAAITTAEIEFPRG